MSFVLISILLDAFCVDKQVLLDAFCVDKQVLLGGVLCWL